MYSVFKVSLRKRETWELLYGFVIAKSYQEAIKKFELHCKNENESFTYSKFEAYKGKIIGKVDIAKSFFKIGFGKNEIYVFAKDIDDIVLILQDYYSKQKNVFEESQIDYIIQIDNAIII